MGYFVDIFILAAHEFIDNKETTLNLHNIIQNNKDRLDSNDHHSYGYIIQNVQVKLTAHNELDDYVHESQVFTEKDDVIKSYHLVASFGLRVEGILQNVGGTVVAVLAAHEGHDDAEEGSW